MATNKQSFIPKDIEDFTTDLYDYIWTKHKFTSSSLEKEFTDKLSLTSDKPKKTSNFDECIGNAVLCSQYLLREYCNYKFKRCENYLIESNALYCICVFDAIFSWIEFRNDIFVSIIDTAAIAAEAVLFCDTELKLPVELDRASFTFKIFLTMFLQWEFYPNGGWSALKAKALQDYQILHLDLEPFIGCKNYPYGKLDHSCDLIKQLRKSPVQFPIPDSMFCTSCKEPSENVRGGYGDRKQSFYQTLKENFSSNSISNNEEILQNIDEIDKWIIAAYDYDLDQSEFESELKTVTKDVTFQCILLGKEEEQEQEVESARPIKSRRHKRKGSKPSKSTEAGN